MRQDCVRSRANPVGAPIYYAYFADTAPLDNARTGIILGIGPENDAPRAILAITCTEQLDHLVAELAALRLHLRCA